MPWIRKLLKGKKVWALCDTTGKLHTDSQRRVDIMYHPKGRIYQAALTNLSMDEEILILTDDEAQPGPRADALRLKKTQLEAERKQQQGQKAHLQKSSASKQEGKGRDALIAEPDEIMIFTDGACLGNPGPMGIGVVILDAQHSSRKEISEFIGYGTNNIAELTAILRGLEQAPKYRRVVVYSDSAYALGVVFQGWKAKANLELIEEIKEWMRHFLEVRFEKVLGHSGIPENERCDELARLAAQAQG